MNLLFLTLLVSASYAVDFHLPKLYYGRLLEANTDYGAMISKSKQCFHTQWNFSIPDPLRQEAFGEIMQEYCDKIPMIDEFRKEIECDKYKNGKVYDYTEETFKISCILSPDNFPNNASFRSELEMLFWYNKLSFTTIPTEHLPTVWFDAAGFGSGWDMEVTFVQNALRARPLFCDNEGVMLEICVPMAHNKQYGDVEIILDIGAFNPSMTEFVFTRLPKTALTTHSTKQMIGFNEELCKPLFDFGMACEETAISACNVTTFEGCDITSLSTSDNFTFVREFGQFHLVATKEKEMQMTPASGDVRIVPIPSNMFLLAIGEGESVTIGSTDLESIKGTSFAKTQTFLISELGEKKMASPFKKNFIEKWLGFFGK